jgi:hypothetical protein
VKHSLLVSLLLVLLESACVAQGQEPWKTQVLARGLTLQVPAGVTVARHRPTEDFELLLFKRGSNTILKIYLGNQPDFPKQKAAVPIQKETINGVHAESAMQHNHDGTISREVLFRLRDNGVWPQRMHCWYANLGAKESAEADQILSSVHLALTQNH